MCGISGVFGQYDQNAITGKLAVIKQNLQHRGPDEFNYYMGPHVFLANNRLSIFDIPNGQQPFLKDRNQTGGLVITYNGAIYNHVELREQLLKAGLHFRSNSDTEVILNGYQHWGQDLPRRLNGKFAFSIYDPQNETLFCARDPHGQVPFFYSHQEGAFVFASELTAIEPYLSEAPKTNTQSISSYLRLGGFNSEKTLLDGVYKLRPGHSVTVKNNELFFEKYYTTAISVQPKRPEVSNVAELLKSAIVKTCRGDAPITVTLSGGLDSSAVAALIRKHQPHIDLEAYHVSSEFDSYNEYPFAKRVADHLGIRLNAFTLNMEQITDLAIDLPSRVDEPLCDHAFLGKYYLAAQIKRSYKVCLIGEGSDEFFGGYLLVKAFYYSEFLRHVPRPLRGFLEKRLPALIPVSDRYKSLNFLAKRFFRASSASSFQNAIHLLSHFSNEGLRDVLQDSQDQEIQRIFQEHEPSFPTRGRRPKVDGFMELMQNVFLSNYSLPVADRAYMLNSVESRAPLLDKDLVEYLNGRTWREKMPGFNYKQLLKSAVGDLLPKEIVQRPKMGLGFPVARLFFQEKLLDDFQKIFAESVVENQGIFHYQAIQRLLTQHRRGEQNNYRELWALYTLQKWLLRAGSSRPRDNQPKTAGLPLSFAKSRDPSRTDTVP